MSAQPVTLSPPQQRQFEKLGREFDARQHAKALRTAESILSMAPDHADTIAMRGLTLHFMERKEEGYAEIKRAIATYPKSTVAWHSLGMCQRNDKDVSSALKAFKQALVTDPKNNNILRDIACVCIQLRDWQQFLDIREKMVTLKAGVRANWVALSCGHKMLGNPKLAAAVMEVMTNIMDCGENPVEISEVHLYRIELEIESGNAQHALELLKQHENDVLDAPTKIQLRARAHAMIGQKAEAEKRYLELLALGISEADSIAAMAQLRKIPLDHLKRPKHEVEKYMQLLDQVLAACPKCDYAKRHVLDCVPIEMFKEKLQAYAINYIRRMIPSLFSVLKSLYVDPARAAIIGEVFTTWEAELAKGDFDTSFGGDKNVCYILWIWIFLASHYRRVENNEKALEYIEKAIAHTPTLELLYSERAKIYARVGKTKEAAEQADFARLLDLQDKYLNAKAAKYFFRDNQVEKGEETLQLFLKAPVTPGETYLNILESQCYWYEKEVGEAFYRRGDYVAALQNLLMFELHHRQNHNELLDFHNYVFRRNTMRAWFDVMRSEDEIEANKFFLTFCPCLVRTYMKIHELGEAAVRAAHVPRPALALDDVTADDATRLRNLQRDYVIAPESIDLSEPLVKARRYLADLLAHREHDPASHVLAVELYTVLEKPVLVAKALSTLQKLSHKDTAVLVAQFESGLLAQKSASMDARVKAVVDELMQQAKATS